MGRVLVLLAAPSAHEVARRAEGLLGKAQYYLETYWYIAIPGGFVGVFLAIYLIARAKMK
ncbi:MAG: hypothetical protein HZA54_02860 [Planctomycetes bacterium]|nr:hypothetical protein [Planctomycetota bacterium]